MDKFDYAVVCFLDILGYANMVDGDAASPAPKALPRLQDIVSSAAKLAENGPCDVRLFSDCMMLAAPLSPEAVVATLALAKEVQWAFVSRGVLVRGGISYGQHFASSQMIFSKGLVDAYRLESQRAKNPRVLLDPEFLPWVEHAASNCPELADLLKTRLLRDEDGLSFMQYLTPERMPLHLEQVKAQLKTAPKDPRVQEKIRWLVDYHNYCDLLFGTDAHVGDLEVPRFRNP